VGALGDLGVLSFGRGKGRTGGHGGALLATSPRGVELARSVAAGLKRMATGTQVVGMALLLAQWILGRPLLYGIPQAIPGLGLGETRYHDPRPPSAIGRLAAGVVLAGTDAYRLAVEGRRELAARWSARLAAM
ncbi:MAG: hypothetical protein ACYC2K_13775, partial [Gemmatimonadales bacterium]